MKRINLSGKGFNTQDSRSYTHVKYRINRSIKSANDWIKE